MTETTTSSVPSELPKKLKPFCWPLALTVSLTLISAALLLWQWFIPEYFNFLRLSWILITSVIPGLNLMVMIGSMVQFRLRPRTSLISLALGIASLFFCWWCFHQMTELGQVWLK